MKPLRLGIDAACWTNRRGYGRFTRGLVGALAERDEVEVTLVADRSTAAAIVPPAGASLLVTPATVAASEAASASGRRSARDLIRSGLAASRAGFDLFFFPSVYTYFPLFSRTPQVVAIHDAIPEQLPALVFPERRLRLFWTIKVRWAIRAARRIITVSPFAARQVRERLGVSPQRLRVVSEAPDPIFTPTPEETIAEICRQYSLVRPYLLFVGGLSPHKDLPTLLRAAYRLDRDAPGIQVAIAGEVEGDSFFTEPVRLRALAEALGIADRVRWLGFVPDQDLAALYSGATALVLPSLAEGFGLPVVEAAACGCPVVASDASQAAEVIAAARVFPAGDDAALAAAVRPLLDPAERTRDGALAHHQAAAYRWETAAEQAIAIFREAVG
ncbi:MAG: glycosyltransferase family 1 protein [Dehalococcoidia bacterium]